MTWLDQYRTSLKPISTEEPLDLFVYRPGGFIVAKLLQRTLFTPNHVTIASMLCGVAAGVLYASGKSTTTFAAGIAFWIANVLDCADGQLARLKTTSSELGKILDGIADYVTGTAVLLGMAIGYSHAFTKPWMWWGLVAAAGVSNTIQSILVDIHRNRFLALSTAGSHTLEGEYEAFSEKHGRLERLSFGRMVVGMYRGYIRFAMTITKPKPIRIGPADREQWVQKNRPVIRAWTLIGSSTRISIAVFASLFNRPDLYLLAIVGPVNLAMAVLSLVQSRIDSQGGD